MCVRTLYVNNPKNTTKGQELYDTRYCILEELKLILLNVTVKWWRYCDEAHHRHEPMGSLRYEVVGGNRSLYCVDCEN